jgi:hypothetical protein
VRPARLRATRPAALRDARRPRRAQARALLQELEALVDARWAWPAGAPPPSPARAQPPRPAAPRALPSPCAERPGLCAEMSAWWVGRWVLTPAPAPPSAAAGHVLPHFLLLHRHARVARRVQ